MNSEFPRLFYIIFLNFHGENVFLWGIFIFWGKTLAGEDADDRRLFLIKQGFSKI